MPLNHFNRWRGGSSEVVYIKITNSELSRLFGVKIRTIRQWIYDNKIDPYNLLDIIEKYNNPHLLDHRRKQ